MKLREIHPQVSPDPEICELCAQEGHGTSVIQPFVDYHIVVTTDGYQMNLCDTHFYAIATLQ